MPQASLLLLLSLGAQTPPPPVMQPPVPVAPEPSPAQPPPSAPAAAPQPAPPAAPDAAPPAPPPAVEAPPLRLVVAPCDAPSGIAGPSLSDLAMQGLAGMARVALLPAQTAAPSSTDPTALAVFGARAGADKVVCVSLEDNGTHGVVATWMVDTATAETDFSRVAVATENTPDAARAVAAQQGQMLAAFVAQGFAPPPVQAAAPPPPAQPEPPPPQNPAVAGPPIPRGPLPPPPFLKDRPAFLNVWRGAGLALMAVGAALLPASVAAVVVAGAAHIGSTQLMLLPPGEPAPRYVSAYFTLTWGDLLTGAVLAGAGLLALAGGAVLFMVPFALD